MMNCLGDAHHWSENTCWIFDADFEYLPQRQREAAGVTGARVGTKAPLPSGGAGGAHRLEADEIRAAELLRYTPGDVTTTLLSMARTPGHCRMGVYDHMKGRRPPGIQGGAERGSGMKVEHPGFRR